jgi:branched-chain amino acid transport system substrate-binding protein
MNLPQPDPHSSSPRPHSWRAVLLACLALILAACLPGVIAEPSTPAPDSLPTRVPAPVTVVTRMVLSERIVMATPTPPQPCAPVDLGELGAGDEVVVGAVLPLSRAGALAGSLSLEAAFLLARGDINDAGGIAGHPLRVALRDADTPERAARAAEELIAQECAVALVGGYHSDLAGAVLDVAQRSNVPFLVIEASDDSLTATRLPQVFRLSPNSTMQAAFYGEWLAAVGDYNGDGLHNAAIIIENSPAGAKQADMIAAGLDASGIRSTVYTVDLPATDFSSAIARVVVADALPDAVIVRIDGNAGYELIRQLVANGLGPAGSSAIVAMRGALSDAHFWESTGAGGAYVAAVRSGAWPSTVSEIGDSFARRHQSLTGKWPDGYAFAAYDSLHLLTDAIARAGSVEPGALIAALESADLTLAGGRYAFPYGAHNPPEETGAPASAWHQRADPQLFALQYTAPHQPAADMAVLWPVESQTAGGPIVRPAEQQ